MDKLSEIVLPGALHLLAAAGLVLILAGAALWSGRFPVKRVRALLTGEDAGRVSVMIEESRDGAVDNITLDPSRYEFDIGVSYSEDPEDVIAILKRLGDELRSDPACGPGVVGPLEILGVDRFEDSAVVVRCRITTKPIGQQRVRHEITRRLDKAFKRHVIEIPFPRRETSGIDLQAPGVRPLYVLVDDKESGGNGAVSET
jgi:small conductance mechanosensitive channel